MKLKGTEAVGSANAAADLAESLGMKTGRQRHRDKDECRRCYGKIGRLVAISPRT
jgi:hypothetical protein